MAAMMTRNGEGRPALVLSGKHLVGFVVFCVCVCPMVWTSGVMYSRLTHLEAWKSDHQAEVEPLKKTLLADHETMATLASSTQRLAEAQDKILNLVQSNQTRISVIESRLNR